MSIARYDPAAVDTIAATLELREPNASALHALARALASAAPGAELVAELATGVGKTYVAGGLLDYLHGSGVRTVVIITPGSTIQRKTIDNLTPGHPKYLRGLRSDPVVITLDDVERGALGQALEDPDAFLVFVFTVQSLLRPDTRDNRRAHRPHEMLGRSLTDHLRECPDLVVIADEHHVYFSGNARRFQSAITALRPAALIGLTATPHASTPPENIVFRYALAAAIADGFVKIPVLVARADPVADERPRLADGLALLDAKRAALRAFCDRTGAQFVEPVMFVVASTIDEARGLRDLLVGPDLLGAPDQVLLVTSAEPDETLRLLAAVEQPWSRVRAVVSVSMLKEGWDVKNIYVIASVRALESAVLTEQILGRGLRLPFGHRTGVDLLDSIDVLPHRSFGQLMDRAGIARSASVGQRTATLLDEAAELERLDPRVTTVETRLDDALEATVALNTPLVARSVGGLALPLDLPQVSRRQVRRPVGLAQLRTQDAEALGVRFAAEHLATRRAEDDGPPRAGHDAAEPSRAEIAMVLVRRLVATDEVAATADEVEAGFAIALAFLAAAGVTETGPERGDRAWREDLPQLATQALTARLRERRAAEPTLTLAQVTTVPWPVPAELLQTVRALPRELVTGPSAFVPGRLYRGWDKAVFDVARFSAAGEFRLAELFENSAEVVAWAQLTGTVASGLPGWIVATPPRPGSASLVVDDRGGHWLVDARPQGPPSDPALVARRAAATAWTSAVNASRLVGPRWGCLLVSETTIAASAGSWSALVALAGS